MLDHTDYKLLIVSYNVVLFVNCNEKLFINFYVFVKNIRGLKGFHCVLFDVTMQEV